MQCSSRFPATFVAIAVGVLCSATAADVVLLSQYRSVSTEAYADHFDGTYNDDSDGRSTPAPGSWSATAHAYATSLWLYGDGNATQDSVVSAGRLQGIGTADVDVDANHSLSDAGAWAESWYFSEFQVTETQVYDAVVNVASGGDNSFGWSYVELYDSDFRVVFSVWSDGPFGSFDSWSDSGTLNPGVYQLNAHAYTSVEVHVDTGLSWAEFEFALDVPAPSSAFFLAAPALLTASRRRQ